MRGEDIVSPARMTVAVATLSLNYARGAQTKMTPKVNTWPGFFAGQIVINVDASFREGDCAA